MQMDLIQTPSRFLRLFCDSDYSSELLAGFPAVFLDCLGWICLQQFPEFGIGPCLRINLAPIGIGWSSHGRIPSRGFVANLVLADDTPRSPAGYQKSAFFREKAIGQNV